MRRITNKYTPTRVSEFYCTLCGQKGIPIVRRAGQAREAGHLKRLWCTNCEMVVNFVEVRGYGAYTKKEFLFEYTYGNFDAYGNRIEPDYKKFIRETLNKIEKKDLPKTDIYYQILGEEKP